MMSAMLPLRVVRLEWLTLLVSTVLYASSEPVWARRACHVSLA